jgi:hypothetical protein
MMLENRYGELRWWVIVVAVVIALAVLAGVILCVVAGTTDWWNSPEGRTVIEDGPTAQFICVYRGDDGNGHSVAILRDKETGDRYLYVDDKGGDGGGLAKMD